MIKPLTLTQEVIESYIESIRKDLKNARVLPSEFKIGIPTLTLKDAGVKKPKLIITKEAQDKMNQLIDECSVEIGWHGLVNRKDNVFTVYDILVFPQAVDATNVIADEKKYPEWIMGLSDDEINHLRFHGHSHVNMGCFASMVDTDYQQRLMTTVDDFYIFGIFNKKGNYELFLYDRVTNLFYDTKDITYKPPVTIGNSWAKKQISKYVTVPRLGYVPHSYTHSTTKPGSVYDAVKRKTNPELYGGRKQPAQSQLELLDDYYNRGF